MVALLPGSRRSEIQYIAPRLFARRGGDERARPGCASSLPVVTGLRHAVEPCASSTRRTRRSTLLDGRAHDALAACDVALVASGTATLEAALFKRPMVVVYAMHALTWQMGKRMDYQPWVVAAQHPAARLRRSRAAAGRRDAGKIAAAAFKWLDDPGRRESLRVRFEGIHRALRRDTGALATAAIEAVLDR